MEFDTLNYIIKNYGLRLDTSKLALALGTTTLAEIRNKISEGTFYIKMYRDEERSQWVADARDVAEYLDSKHTTAAKPISLGRDVYTASKTSNPSVPKSKRPPQSSIPSQRNGKSPHV